MASGRMTENGITAPLRVLSDGVTLAAGGVFGGGTMTLQHRVAGEFEDALVDGVVANATIPTMDEFKFHRGSVIRFVLTGATAPAIRWEANDAVYL